ncbi:MmgE/PrpD family protein [Mesorhizobium xinjiangense]|uniref:MmgE/PrpD family protein n=1 Tax=Mesorhizobium xinjiangense TaxID=2678685 RepID=UPI0012ED1C60|nr:MmgE/PrpD family protein [Mesorhizobium xinjiangense]
MGLAEILAHFAVDRVAVSEKMAQAIRFSLFDWATVGLAGRAELVARASRAVVLAEGGAGQAALFGGGRAPARGAALVNGATSHALDYDDTHFLHIGHPSVAVIPAAIAVAEREDVSGAALSDALAVGLELACRMGDWLGRSHYEAGFHQTGTSGAFGATAAAGRLMGLDAEQMAHALGLVATRAAGLKSQFGTMGKPLNAGFAAEVGVASADLARHGVTSNPDAIAGGQGFGPTHAGAARESAWAGLGQDWAFPGVSYKFHACCHGLHAMLEALRSLREAGLKAADVEAVTVVTNPRWLAVCNQPAPTTGLGAKFSYRLTAAMMLAGVDTAALENYSAELAVRPDLVALRDRVMVEADSGLTDTQARVEVTTIQGVRLPAWHDLAALADAATLEERLREKSHTLIGPQAEEALWHDVAALGAASNIDMLAARIGG